VVVARLDAAVESVEAPSAKIPGATAELVDVGVVETDTTVTMVDPPATMVENETASGIGVVAVVGVVVANGDRVVARVEFNVERLKPLTDNVPDVK
jgi:hypothetical protein